MKNFSKRQALKIIKKRLNKNDLKQYGFKSHFEVLREVEKLTTIKEYIKAENYFKRKIKNLKLRIYKSLKFI